MSQLSARDVAVLLGALRRLHAACAAACNTGAPEAAASEASAANDGGTGAAASGSGDAGSSGADSDGGSRSGSGKSRGSNDRAGGSGSGGRSGAAPSPPPAWRAALWARSRAALERHQFQPQGLTAVAYSIACLKLVSPPGWRDAFLAESRRQMPVLGAQALCNLIWAVAELQWDPPAAWLDAYHERCETAGALLKGRDQAWVAVALDAIASRTPPPPPLAAAAAASAGGGAAGRSASPVAAAQWQPPQQQQRRHSGGPERLQARQR